jgi:2-iminoacetate synthase
MKPLTPSPRAGDKDSDEYKTKRQQFSLQDHRPLDTVVRDLLDDGFIPSFCTACYRKSRTGEAFMKIAKSGDIQSFCQPNALLTLEEYVKDYASEETRQVADRVIERERESMSSQARKAYEKKRAKLKEGARDLYF